MSGRGNCHVEIQPAAFDLLGKLRAADEVGAGLFRFAHLLALCKDEHALRLAEPGR